MRLISLSLLLGTLSIQWFEGLLSWEVVLVVFCLLIAMTFMLKKRSIYLRHLLLLSSSFVLGFMLATIHASFIISKRISDIYEGQELIIQGKVIDIPSVRGDGVRFLLKVNKAMLNAEPDSNIKFKGIVRLAWFKEISKINAGESWQLKVKLKRPSGFMNPDGFDYEKWLFTQRIVATGYVRDGPKINKRIAPASLWSINNIRQKIHSNIQNELGDTPSAAVVSALLVAVRDDLSDRQWQLLQETGTSHLIAISGLHIAVVAGFAFFPIMLIWRLFPALNERVPLAVAAGIVGALFAIIYALLAGFTLPTQRALLMVLIGLWGLVSRRSHAASSVLALALILVIILDPLAPLTASFWLSFLAVALILFFLKRQVKKARFWVVKLQLFLSLAMLPLTLMFFGTASLTAPVANLFAIPWLSLVIVPISLIALIIMPFSASLSTVLLSLVGKAIDFLFVGFELISNSTLARFTPTEIPISLLILSFVGLLFLFLAKGFPARWLAILFFVPAISYQPNIPDDGEFKYTLLDVGQGFASVLQTKNHTLIYDTGSRFSDSFDMGKIVVAPYLRAKGIKAISMLVISHEDIDHRGGAQHLVNQFQIERIVSSDIHLFKNTEKCVLGMQWQWDGINFEFLSPAKDFQGNDNNSSCVLKVFNQYQSLLLTGDIQKPMEKVLLQTIATKLKADVIAVPHHGSKTSSSQSFINAVSPAIGLISAAYRSHFGHPNAAVVKRYQHSNIKLLNTATHGAISLKFPKTKSAIQIESYRLKHKRFWHR